MPREEEEEQIEEEPLVISAALAEEGNVLALLKPKGLPPPPVEVVDRAMIAAARCGHEKITTLFLKQKIDANTQSSATALDYYIKEHQNLSVVQLFLKSGLNANSPISCRVFEYASDNGKIQGLKAVNEFLQHGFRPTSDAGYKGLQLAAQSGHEGIVKAILTAKANPLSHAGAESLKTASLMGQFKVVQLLLDAGADATCDSGSDALNASVHIGNESLVKLLLKSGADPSAGLPAAAFRNNYKFVKMLIDKQADPSARKKALKEAARYGHMEITNILLKTGTDVRSRAGDSALRLVHCTTRPTEVQDKLIHKLMAAGARRLPPLRGMEALPGTPSPTRAKAIGFSQTHSGGFGRSHSSSKLHSKQSMAMRAQSSPQLRLDFL